MSNSRTAKEDVAWRFASSTQQGIEKLLEDKDSKNTKRSTKVAKELFYLLGFCDIRNNQGPGECYQPKPKPKPDNTYFNFDYSGYHKNLLLLCTNAECFFLSAILNCCIWRFSCSVS